MSKEEIAEKLDEFQEFLSISNILTDIIRWIGWIFIQGLTWIVDKLENLTDDILLIKTFYQNDEIVAFVESIRPFLYILFAFSLLYAGYMLIFQKKFNREGMAINLFIALTILALLGTGIDKGNEFTDEAIEAIKVESLFPNDESSLSNSIIHRNVTDLVEFDKSNWEKIDKDITNSAPPSKIANINVKEKYNKDLDGISKEGKKISKYFLSFNSSGDYTPKKMDQSGLEWNNEYYFRYSINWFTIIVTLAIIAFTVFSIALKLAKLFFELTFNYILALIIAPVDIHDGQKTKKILQAILNTFIATILIFLSMKVYMIGTAYLESTLSTFPYLIALIAFSLAVLDGPNIVERLFGIDAGLKSGWGVLAGAYAGSKVVGGAVKGASRAIGAINKNNDDHSGSSKIKNRPSDESKPPSPNDTPNNDSSSESKKDGVGDSKNKKDNQSRKKEKGEDKNSETEETNNNEGTNNKESVAKESEKEKNGMDGKGKKTAPSPNDKDAKLKGETVSGNSSTNGNESTNTSTNNGGNSTAKSNSTTPKPTSAGDVGKGSNETVKNKTQQKSTIRTDTDVDHVVDEVEGTQNVNTKNIAGGSRKTDTKPTSSGNSTNYNDSGSHENKKTTIQQRSTVQQDVDVNNQVVHAQGTTNTRENMSKTERKRPLQYKIPNANTIEKIKRSKD